MRKKRRPIFSSVLAIILIVTAGILLSFQWMKYRNIPDTLIHGSSIAGIPVGGLSASQAADRIRQAYNQPLELNYKGADIQVEPTTLGFQLKVDAMVADCIKQSGKSSFMGFMTGKKLSPCNVDLQYTINDGQITEYLKKEIITRYDQPPASAVPIPGDPQYIPGQPGYSLVNDQAVSAIQVALPSLQERVVNLPVHDTPPSAPSWKNLETQINQLIKVSGFDGLTEIYLQNMKNGDVIHFATMDGKEGPMGAAYTAASTMKIPIMLSVLSRVSDPVPDEVVNLLERMIVYSQNPASDSLMASLDPTTGPLVVTDDLQKLGLKNTFIAGFFKLGAPLLKRFNTPANTRTDINLNPDVYNQTTPEEIGWLLQSIYKCAKTGHSEITDKFQGKITQGKCQLMIDLLSRNKIGLLTEAGVPDGTQVAHKHGWIEESDGLLHTMSDVAIIFTPGGDYVLTIYVYHPSQLVFNPANLLIARISEAVYNYFNTPLNK